MDDRYIKTIHLHSSSGSNGSGGSGGSSKNSHRSKVSTNSQSRDKHDSSIATRTRSLASQFSISHTSAHGEYWFLFLFSFIAAIFGGGVFYLLLFKYINSNAVVRWLFTLGKIKSIISHKTFNAFHVCAIGEKKNKK